MVVSDEIHCELVYDGYKYTPFASISEACRKNSVVCCSPSKSFNIAGLQIANIISDSEQLRNRIDRAININEVCDVNPFGVVALMAAYNHGEEWLDELKTYLWENYRTLLSFFKSELPDFPVTKLEGTYLVWIDCRSLGIESSELERKLMDVAGVWLNEGTMYGDAGEGFMRINIACPRSVLEEGLRRIKKGVDLLR